MAKRGKSAIGPGAVTKRTGTPNKVSGGTGRGFTPPGARSAAKGPAVRRAAGDLKVGPRTAANKVEGKG